MTVLLGSLLEVLVYIDNGYLVSWSLEDLSPQKAVGSGLWWGVPCTSLLTGVSSGPCRPPNSLEVVNGAGSQLLQCSSELFTELSNNPVLIYYY